MLCDKKIDEIKTEITKRRLLDDELRERFLG